MTTTAESPTDSSSLVTSCRLTMSSQMRMPGSNSCSCLTSAWVYYLQGARRVSGGRMHRQERAWGRLVLAGAPHVREEEVEVLLLWQVEDWWTARGGQAERRHGEGKHDPGDVEEAEYAKHRDQKRDDKHAGGI